jgi:hypothetical protein
VIDVNICKILARLGVHMNLNESCNTDDFLIKSCPTVVHSSYVLPVIKINFINVYQSDDLYVDLTCFIF